VPAQPCPWVSPLYPSDSAFPLRLLSSWVSLCLVRGCPCVWFLVFGLSMRQAHGCDRGSRSEDGNNGNGFRWPCWRPCWGLQLQSSRFQGTADKRDEEQVLPTPASYALLAESEPFNVEWSNPD